MNILIIIIIILYAYHLNKVPKLKFEKEMQKIDLLVETNKNLKNKHFSDD